MNRFKNAVLIITSLAWFGAITSAQAGCCEDAKKAGKTYEQKCCIEAAKQKKTCEKGYPKQEKKDQKK